MSTAAGVTAGEARYAPHMRAGFRTPLLLVALLVTGCGGDSEQPAALPPVVTTQTPTTAPSPTTAPVPTEALAETPQGAAQFARFFYAEVERAFAEKDPSIVERLSAPDCGACDRFTSSITSLRDNGGRVTDVIYDIKVAEAPATDRATALVTVIYDSPAIQGFDAQGNQVREEPAVTDFQEQIELIRTPDGWRVQTVTVIQ